MPLTYPGATTYPGSTLYPLGVDDSVPPSVTTFDIRLRAYTIAGVRGKVLPTLSLSVTDPFSAQAVIKFSLSDRVAATAMAEMIVGVEYVNSTGAWVPIRNDRFLAQEVGREDTDPAGVMDFTGVCYVPWLMDRAIVGANGAAVEGEVPFTTASVGTILDGLFDVTQARGALAGVTWAFTTTHDSASVGWPAGNAISAKYRTTETLSSVLHSLTEQGLCEWWTEGMTLKVVIPGTGTDRHTTIVLGPDAAMVPLRQSITGIRTHMYVTAGSGENTVTPFVVTNTGATTAYGRLEAAMSQSGVEDVTTATRLAEGALLPMKTAAYQRSARYPAETAPAHPWRDYTVGDLVQFARTDANESLRVVEVLVEKDNDGAVSITTTLAHRFTTLVARLVGRVATTSSASVVGGSGLAVPPPVPPTTGATPKAPTGLSVVSNVGYWGDGNVPYARVNVGWTAVTQDIDNQPITVLDYEVWQSYDSGEWEVIARVTGTEIDLDPLPPSVPVSVKVIARAVGGGLSADSSTLNFTSGTPLVTITAPTVPSVVSSLALVVAIWDGMLVGPVAPSPTLLHVVAEWSTTSGGTYTVFGAPMQAAGSVTLTGQPVGSTRWVRLKAVSRDGTTAVTSGVSVVVVGVMGADIAANTITANKITAGTITTNELAASVGTDLDITSNGTVTIIAGQAQTAQQDATLAASTAEGAASTAAAAQSSATGASTVATAAAAEAGTASAAAADATALAVAAQQGLDATSSNLATMQTYYAFGVDGAMVSSPGSPFAVAIRSDRIEMLENGGVVSYWNAGQMVVNQFVGIKVTLGNHQIEAITGGTVVRAL